MNELLQNSAEALESIAMDLSEAVKASGVPVDEIPVQLANLEKARDAETRPILNQIAQLESQVAQIEKKHEPGIAPIRDLKSQVGLAKGIEAMLKDHVGMTIGDAQ